ncbi:alkaline shock response membrane anchor protein AmaP [Desulfofundulus thermobenzoicus]|uniref:Alkaline shock response membrane anchor protein AmaP n=1 Tax=Desulfofundulus thermobenzoicus TaxID=29376 RepID=A0A6N7IPZ5_9FIRM|nr:alkaline shock response membrane anchor protein AmaP [Desulfofundulus thermobenzoicus]MQL52102.1 alkaline shock response membrane anchor protein AmaP [Desulfofundulus thermobenzoicus]
MGPFDRGLMVVYTLILTITLIFAGGALLGLLPSYRIWDGLNRILEQPFDLAALLLVFILMGARLFWVGIRPGGPRAVVHEAAHGQVRIALVAIQHLVEKVALQLNGVREAAARVYPGKEGIRINVRVAVTPDISIPECCHTLQRQVQERVLAVTGITVQDVAVTVKSISAQKPRVE